MKNSQNEATDKPIETHPLKPFLPQNTKLLMLGSFPPPRSKWGMEFYYPNFINDMWRIFGLVFFGNKTHFLLDSKHFDRERIESFLSERGIGVADSVSSAVRLRDNASDNFLRVIKRTDISSILRTVPQCKAIITAGEKSTNEALASLNSGELAKGLKLGKSVKITLSQPSGRQIELFRLPSSSRAYPLKLEAKADFYAKVFNQCGLL